MESKITIFKKICLTTAHDFVSESARLQPSRFGQIKVFWIYCYRSKVSAQDTITSSEPQGYGTVPYPNRCIIKPSLRQALLLKTNPVSFYKPVAVFNLAATQGNWVWQRGHDLPGASFVGLTSSSHSQPSASSAASPCTPCLSGSQPNPFWVEIIFSYLSRKTKRGRRW